MLSRPLSGIRSSRLMPSLWASSSSSLSCLPSFSSVLPTSGFSSSKPSSVPIRRTTALKNMLKSNKLEYIMEAHNGLSAKIVEETGFKGIWASGLSMSAAMCVRDSNEASYTQILEVLEFMADSTELPILVDADTGYGNFNNARRLVKKLEQRGIAGACIEDKLFPKSNSLLSDDITKGKPLAPIEEFCLKIKAMKDTAKDPDFVVVARMEAFIAGWPLEEALRRAELSKEAGADAILIHSKKKEPSEIKSFCQAFAKKHPTVIVPTKYYTTPTQEFRDWGVSLVIWANHNMRASVSAMQRTSKAIFEAESLVPVEEAIAPVNEVFRITGQPELTEAEKLYLPKPVKPTKK